ncbi:uncharacterized protein LOC115449208 isoform X3 [Manduca sexta]|uniref:uncharacterized protein LOC115449208 isoform X3 n=1 Tax=Manduca sexta TaxID=7130 RepID=UPI00188E797F|nr:uncharacterized protein LOC115449208 isoform X3 [Manduca sexta]
MTLDECSNKSDAATCSTSIVPEGTSGTSSDPEGRCHMIEIPLSAKQFEEIHTSPADAVSNELDAELEVKIENADEVPDNTSLYCDEYENVPEQSTQQPGVASLFNGFQCSICNNEIVGFRYTCVQCSDLDLCGACEADGAHHQHYVLRIPADRSTEETETVLATIRLHLMKDLDPIAELEPDPGKSVALEIKSEREEDSNITIEDEGINYAVTFDPIITDKINTDESMAVSIEGNGGQGNTGVQLNSSVDSMVTSETKPTQKLTGTKRNIGVTTSELQNTIKGKKIRVVPNTSSYIDANLLSPESSRAIKIKLPPPSPTSGVELVKKSSLPCDSSKNTTRVYSYNTIHITPDCIVRMSTVPHAIDVGHTSSQYPSEESSSTAQHNS